MDSLPSLAAGTLAFLFGFAGVMKLLTLSDFQSGLRALPGLGPAASRVAGISLPLLELLLAAFLLRGSWFASAAAIALLLLFVGVAAYAVRKRLSVPCTCFGRGGSVLSIGTIRRNCLLVAVGIISLFREPRPLSVLDITDSLILLLVALSAYQTFANRHAIIRLQAIGALAP